MGDTEAIRTLARLESLRRRALNAVLWMFNNPDHWRYDEVYAAWWGIMAQIRALEGSHERTCA